ncbi:MAG: hypothetical protein HRT73_06880, partial [Flavobacteriales bacterium]|nr:hypothetical protein [Flavobacteriales bacterium]
MLEIKKNMDESTITLLTELSKEFEISFNPWDKNYNEVFTQNKKAVINYNIKSINTETLAHELLHIWLKKFNYLSSNHIYLSFVNEGKLSKIFTKYLCDFIGNYMDHYKMYPKYINMGYKPEKFTQEGLQPKCSLLKVKALKLNFLGIYNA